MSIGQPTLFAKLTHASSSVGHSADNFLPLALEVSIDLVHEVFGAEVVSALLDLVTMDADSQILGHVTCLDGINYGGFKCAREFSEELIIIQLCSVAEPLCPCEDRGNWVGRRGLALLPLSVVASDSSVSGLRLNHVVLIKED